MRWWQLRCCCSCPLIYLSLFFSCYAYGRLRSDGTSLIFFLILTTQGLIFFALKICKNPKFVWQTFCDLEDNKNDNFHRIEKFYYQPQLLDFYNFLLYLNIRSQKLRSNCYIFASDLCVYCSICIVHTKLTSQFTVFSLQCFPIYY